jgi:plastocyanin
MEQTAFFVVGIALVVAALVVSITGLRYPGFPGSRPVLAGGAALLVLLVVGATTTAVINAREEQKEHNEEAAAEEEQTETQAEETGESPKELEQQGAEEAQNAGGGGGPGLELSAPEDGTLAFDTDELEAGAGEVTIDFTNPAAIEHDVAIGTDGDEIAKSDLVSDGETAEATAKLDPGEYVFYCTVPGHREGGMEGTLTVK